MKHLAAAAVALALAWAAPARAALVTFDFTAVQNGTVGDIPIANGQTFTGSLTIDNSTPVGIGIGGFNYFGAIKSLTLGGTVFNTASWTTNTIHVFDQAIFLGLDVYSFSYTLGMPGGLQLTLGLSGTGPQVGAPGFSTTVPNISAFDSDATIAFSDSTGSANDPLTSLSAPGTVAAVPEPPAAFLFVTLLLAFGWLLRRKVMAPQSA